MEPVGIFLDLFLLVTSSVVKVVIIVGGRLDKKVPFPELILVYLSQQAND